MDPAARLRAWAPALALALAWGLGPALPALLRGELLGAPYTDLYPSVWGLWWFASEQPGLPSWCLQLGAPEGMPLYYSSPLHGWAAWPLLGVLGVPATWNLLVVAARVATVLCSFGAGRAWGLSAGGALVAAAVYGCAPFFQGYAVEGIVEGLDGWTLALWLWAVGRGRILPAALAFALTVASSWYLGAAACVLAVFVGPRGWASGLAGLLLASGLLTRFLGAFPGLGPLDPELRGAMGAHPGPWTPGLVSDYPLALTGWIGLLGPALALYALRSRPWAGAAALACLVLALGVGPWYELPVLEAVRFPYRFLAGALAALALLAGRATTKAWLAPLIVAEGLLLSPIQPLIPGADATVPRIVQGLEGQVLLDIPGMLDLPPGRINLTRRRARSVLYAQTVHRMASPWVLGFNGVGVEVEDGLDAVRALDPASGLQPPTRLDLPASVDWVLLQPGTRGAEELLEQEGWVIEREEEGRTLWRR